MRRPTVTGGRRVAVTGIGIVSTIGIGVGPVAASLRAGRSGVRLLPERRALGFRSVLSGVIDPFEPVFPLSRKARKPMTEFGYWAYHGAMEAIAMSGLPLETLRSPRAGVIFGNDSSCQASHEHVAAAVKLRSTSQLSSGAVFQTMNSSVTMNLASLLGVRGASWTISGACASSAHAVGQAAELIARGRQDVVLCGGAQEISWEGVCSFDALGAFSMREDEPEAASRPFDADRDGLVPSGGAAALVLENLEAAKHRGADILGEILAYAFSSDGYNIALTSGEGLVRCMNEALRDAGVRPADVNLVNAHGTSTPLGDAAEAEAIAAVFGGAKPWVTSTKSLTGHEMWMSGASQVVYSLVMARGGFIAGNRNFRRPDERTASVRVPPETVAETPELVLCNSAGFGGTNACVVLRAAR